MERIGTPARLHGQLIVTALLAGCSADGPAAQFAARDTTVEYYRVFDIRTDAAAPAVAKAASEGINRNVKDAVVLLRVSIGVAEMQPHHKTTDDVLRAAEAALKYAKDSGRNRVVAFSTLAPSSTSPTDSSHASQ